MTETADVAKHLKFDNVKQSNLISYSLKDHANGDSWKEIKIVFNGSTSAFVARIPRGDWTVIARDGQINPDGLDSSRGGSVTVAPTSALILARTR